MVSSYGSLAVLNGGNDAFCRHGRLEDWMVHALTPTRRRPL
jgi:hypothetical protein